MQFKVQLIGESDDGRYWGRLGTLYTALQPFIGMHIDYQDAIWEVRDVTWLPEERDGTWVILDVRVEAKD